MSNVRYTDKPPFITEMLDLGLSDVHYEIWQKAIPLLIKGRFWDLWHTEISIQYMQDILHAENKNSESEILLPAIILHDVGWSAIGEEKNTSWGKSEMRIAHMQEGAKLAKSILEEVSYKAEYIDEIIDLISKHDNAYLGIDPITDNEKLLRDADACFILSYPSFWKDFNVKKESSNMSLVEFEKLIEKHGTRYSNIAQIITDDQIKRRKSEIVDKSTSPKDRFDEIVRITNEKKQSAIK